MGKSPQWELSVGEMEVNEGSPLAQAANDLAFHCIPPTAENIARRVWEQIRAIVEDATATVKVTVEESPGSSVTYSK